MSEIVVVLDVNEPRLVRAFCLQAARLAGGLSGDAGLVVDAAERFEAFIVKGRSPDEVEQFLRSAPSPLPSSPEAPAKSGSVPSRVQLQDRHAFSSPVSGVATETVAECRSRASAAGSEEVSP